MLAFLTLAPGADARTYNVNKRGDHDDGFCSTGDCTVREAVLEANNLIGADKIVLPSRKPYNLTLIGSDDTGQLGDLDVRNDPVRIVHPGKGRATIDANLVGRVFDVYAGATIQNAVITGGSADYGGGIRGVDAGGRITLVRSVVRDNSASNCGGGIHTQDDAPLTLRRSQVVGNFGNQGGGISASCFGNGGPVKIANSTVARNQGDADGNGNGYGGGIYLQTDNDVQSTIADSTFFRNSSGLGGIGAADGGGIYTDLGRLRITGSTIARNTSGDTGGGVYISGTQPLVVVNTTIAENRADANGGGIQLDSGDVTLNAVTVVRNRGNADGVLSEAGGGISADDTPFRVRNSLIALNTLTALSPGDPPVKNDCSGSEPFASLGHNLLSTEFLCDGFDGPRDLVRARPKIGRLDRNGGPTETIALKRRSPAIGKAHKPSAPERDQRGRRRDNHPDIGAFER